LDDPELLPFFAFMPGQYRAIWLHPYYNPNGPGIDYHVECDIEQVCGWLGSQWVGIRGLFHDLG
jgi:hypothetical protein